MSERTGTLPVVPVHLRRNTQTGHTQGGTLEAIANAEEAIQCYIEGLALVGEPIPEETEHPQAIVISVAA